MRCKLYNISVAKLGGACSSFLASFQQHRQVKQVYSYMPILVGEMLDAAAYKVFSLT